MKHILLFENFSTEYKGYLKGSLGYLLKHKKELENKMEFPIRNNHSCHFAIKTIQCYPKLLETINELLKIPEINQGKFFTLDVGWNKETKQYFILEANTASGLNENTSKIYAQYLVENI